MDARALKIEPSKSTFEKALETRIVGNSPAMCELLETVARIGPKNITVLVHGETGTGKELIASLIHEHSNRSSGPLVRFNCAAIPGELAEAELFGHARGAFTGAAQARRGFFALADGGTLVLDEVGELPAAVQAKLLRALQEGEIQPVGAGRVERVGTSRRWLPNSRVDMASVSATSRSAFRRRWSTRSAGRNGRGTSGNSRTPWREWWRSATAA